MKSSLEYSPADPSLEFPDSQPRTKSTGGTPDIWGVAVRAKWLILLGLIAGAGCGQLLYMKLGPSFEASARILVSKRTTAPVKDSDANAALGDRAEHVALIMSPLIVGEAIKKHHLDQLSTLAGKSDMPEEILDSLRVRRSAGQDRSVLNVLDITYASSNPGDAVAVVQAVIDAYQDYLNATRTEHTAETAELISRASRDLLEQLHEKEDAYIAFRERAPLFWKNAPGTEGTTTDTTNVPQERMLAIEGERRLNLLKRAEVLSKIKSLEQAIARGESRQTMEILVRRFLSVDAGGANPIGHAGPGVSGLQGQLLPLILQEEKLLRDYGAGHPDVQSVRKSISTIRDFYEKQGITLPDAESDPDEKPANDPASPTPKKRGIDRIDFVKVYLTSLKQQMEELDIRDRELSGLFEEAALQAKQHARYQIEDQALTGEIKRLKTLWEAILNRLDQLNLVKDNQGYSLKQIAPTREALVAKRQIRMVGIAGAIGMALIFGLCFLRELRDTTLKTTEEIQEQFGLHLLGQVPHFSTTNTKLARRPGSTLDPDLHYAYRPGSIEAEAYRSIRTSLYFCLQGGRKVFEITSPEPQDGKTTIASNLALAVAHSGRRILLIDGDLRCPKVHKLFGMNREIGLAEVLVGEIEAATAIRTTEIDGLSVLCAGDSPANPAELLGSLRFAKLIQEVRDQYDLVIVDAPPLLAVSDACVVAPHTDGVLLVFRIGKTRRRVAQRAQELLTSHGITLLGTVANDTGTSIGYGYGGYANAETTSYGNAPEAALAPATQAPLSATPV